MTKGRTIRMFLVDGNPTGMITAEIMNWTGHVLAAPRTKLAELIQRNEATRTGVYFLTNLSPDNGTKPEIYIGESDNVAKRLTQHNKSEEKGGKDFWDRALIVTSKDQNLTKAHARFLESRLIGIANDVSRAKLQNGNAPEYGYLPEADVADMEFFIEQIRIVLPVLGLDFLRRKPRTSLQETPGVSTGDDTRISTAPQQTEVLYEIISKKHSIHAEASEIDGDFIVLSGSSVRNRDHIDVESRPRYWKLLTQLKEDGIIQEVQNEMRFMQDYAFSSPSAAADLILGISANGRKTWKVKGTEKTYADYQEDQVAAVEKLIPEE
ncbi:DUF4357 domain-containing protein [Alphaproteobacteria bacterium HT1-32]|nr:DUF4357 domain-containing protein [Alphaproteobacteria bacterium HT1-32]